MKNRRIPRWQLAITLAILLACMFTPGIYTVMWHARHGGSLQFAGTSLKVPFAWIGSADYMEANLEKLSPTFLTGTRPISGMTLSKSVEGHHTDEASAMQAWRLGLVALSNGTTPPLEVKTNSRFRCLQMRSDAGGRQVHISCYAFPGTYADFLGRQRDLQDFLKVLQSFRGTS